MKVKKNVRRSEEHSYELQEITAPHLKISDPHPSHSNPSCAHLSLLQMQSKMELFKKQLFPFIYEGANTRSLTVAQLRAEAFSKRAITS